LLLPRFFTAEGRMRLSIQAFVVKTPHHTLLLDACVGNAKERPGVEAFHRRDTDFLGRLRRDAGITPEQVDYVFCTHFH
ncbi:MAG: MBL fold metallo-hydrolase, partial [Gammaproteobacteria bacterium]|nr:MBL fold metallo-hydrolase [Gammaproteobacteria bacterium]NIW35777.1 MBL fold metallo-hydrolase [Gemmatimonadota bacterium]